MLEGTALEGYTVRGDHLHIARCRDIDIVEAAAHVTVHLVRNLVRVLIARGRLLLNQAKLLHRMQPRGMLEAQVGPEVVPRRSVLDQHLLHRQHQKHGGHVLARQRVVQELLPLPIVVELPAGVVRWARTFSTKTGRILPTGCQSRLTRLWRHGCFISSRVVPLPPAST